MSLRIAKAKPAPTLEKGQVMKSTLSLSLLSTLSTTLLRQLNFHSSLSPRVLQQLIALPQANVHLAWPTTDS